MTHALLPVDGGDAFSCLFADSRNGTCMTF